MGRLVSFGSQTPLYSLPESQRDAVARCRSIEPYVNIAEAKGYYKRLSYRSVQRNLDIFRVYCSGTHDMRDIAHLAQTSVSNVSAIVNRIYIETYAKQWAIQNHNVKQGSIRI